MGLNLGLQGLKLEVLLGNGQLIFIFDFFLELVGHGVDGGTDFVELPDRKRLAAGGMIILDDSDRVNTSEEYASAIKICKDANLIQIDFYGFCPMNNYTKTTSLFIQRDFNPRPLAKVQPVNGWGNLWSMRRKDRKEFYKENR